MFDPQILAFIGVAFIPFVTALAGQVRALLGRPQVQRKLEAFTGAVLILFGARLALERR